ncbi:hypothetical protein [Nesterenkonia sp.]|uniref:hypothetical protein n=1 Tax=Nesterenkonia sp. TaxID=704201 RepID=UPI00262028E4|nr:hypothetical protein [Nesterenkonia sp.]
MPITRTDPRTAARLTRPAWTRAVITAAFALFTVFSTGETMTLARLALAAFFVLGAAALWEYVKADPVPAALRAAVSIGAVVWIVSGIAAVFAHSAAALAVIAGIGFLAVGAAELIGALKVRGSFVPARDHLILGPVGMLTGAGLFAGAGLDPHGILGISGMGVVIMAVLLLISAAGLSHEAKAEA